jgi:hypothetical protein
VNTVSSKVDTMRQLQFKDIILFATRAIYADTMELSIVWEEMIAYRKDEVDDELKEVFLSLMGAVNNLMDAFEHMKTSFELKSKLNNPKEVIDINLIRSNKLSGEEYGNAYENYKSNIIFLLDLITDSTESYVDGMFDMMEKI